MMEKQYCTCNRPSADDLWKNSKGNFKMLVKLADKVPVFPNVKNERSMIYVENLAEFYAFLWRVRSQNLSAAECFLRDHGTDGSSDCYGKREKRTSV